jgi:hypothetical protein
LGARQAGLRLLENWLKRAASDRRQRVVTIPFGDTHKFAMSALPPKADIAEREEHVRFVPIADISDVLRLYPRMSGKPRFFEGTEMMGTVKRPLVRSSATGRTRDKRISDKFQRPLQIGVG